MKIYIETQGCTANKAYSEMLKGIYKNDIVDSLRDADLVLINSCALKTPSENTIIRKIKKIKAVYPSKKIQIIGCLPKAFPKHPKLKKYFSELDFERKKIKLGFPRNRCNKLIGLLPVGEGCKNYCSFCSGKLAKGELFSYPEKYILREARKAINDGCKELYLTSQDMGCYGFDRGTNLVELLKKIISINGDFWIRVGMMNPQHILNSLDELISVYKSKKIYKFLHIPIQSGSNRILNSMNRGYTVEEFKRIVNAFRKRIPNITISTDIIVGFPGETKKDFHDTIELIKEIKPEALNLTRYYPRNGTIAAEFPNQLISRDKKERSRELSAVFEKIKTKKNKQWINKEIEVLVNGKGKYKKQYRARNIFYKPIFLNSKKKILGKKIKVRIKGISESCLIGEII